MQVCKYHQIPPVNLDNRNAGTVQTPESLTLQMAQVFPIEAGSGWSLLTSTLFFISFLISIWKLPQLLSLCWSTQAEAVAPTAHTPVGMDGARGCCGTTEVCLLPSLAFPSQQKHCSIPRCSLVTRKKSRQEWEHSFHLWQSPTRQWPWHPLKVGSYTLSEADLCFMHRWPCQTPAPSTTRSDTVYSIPPLALLVSFPNSLQ